MFSLLIPHQLASLLPLCVMSFCFPEQVFGWMRGYTKKKILKDTFCHTKQYLFFLRGCSGSGDPICFLSLPSWQDKKRVTLFIVASYLPVPSFSPFFLSFLLTDTNSLSHFLDFESHLMWANRTGGCSFICFLLLFVLALREQLTNGLFSFFFFFFRLSTDFQCLRGQTLKVVYWRSFPPLLEAVCPWTFFEGR